MKRSYILLFFILMTAFSAFAQKQIKGKVKDAKGAAIASASVNLKDASGNILSFTRTNEKGEYTLSFTEENKELTIEVTVIGFEKKAIPVTELNKSYDLILIDSEISLKTVVVKNRPSLTVNGDTLSYKTSDFADKQDRSIGDVLKKMPGITVDDNGKVSYNGKGISALYQDGENLLDDKYSIGTKAIPHLAVDKVQVIENDQPIKMLRKNNMSDDVAINLVLKDEARLKVMGDIKAGLGTPDRFDGNVNVMLFKKKLKFINNLKGNNIGIDPGNDLTQFNMSDYLKKLDNDKPGSFLSAGAAGVPTLPQNRSLFNKAGLVNLNNLYRFNQDVSIKANIAYLYDQRNQEFGKFSETYLTNETIRYSESQANSVNPQKLQARFNLNGNGEKYYLNNTLNIEYNPYSTQSNVSINGVGAFQSLKQETVDISNELSYRKRLKSENVLNFYSYLNRTTQPELLNIRPGVNEAILNNGIPYAGLNQYVKLPTLYTNNYLSFAWVKNRFTQTYKGGFNLQNQQLNSELYRIQNNSTTELVSANMVNDLNWLKAKLYAEAIYEYSSDKIKAGVSFPLSYNNINYEDPGKLLDKNVQKLFLNPSLNLKYQTSAENYITANYTFKNDLGGIDDVYRGTILKNYRSLFANDAPISERKTQAASAGFNFRRAMQMFFLNLSIGYSNTTLNTISSYTLTNNTQQRIVLPIANQIESLNLGISSSKYLFALKSTINAGVSFTDSRFDQLQNGELSPFYSQTTVYRAGIDSKITKFINWSYNGTYSISNNKSLGANAVKTNFQQLRHSTSITATAFNSLYLTAAAEHIFTQQPTQPNLNYVFADLNAKYRFVKLKTDLEFGITNLANVKKFEAIYVSANSLTSGTYYIPGRVAMLKATFTF